MINRYEIVLEKGDWYEDNYLGPWRSEDKPTFYTDFREALELVFEWGRIRSGKHRKNGKIGIYDHEDDKFYTQDRCFKFEFLIYQ